MTAFGGFFFGYLAILLTPGPNLFAISGVASLSGLRAALPLCVGIALGAGCLCAAITAAVHIDAATSTAARLTGIGLLVWTAVSVARGRPRARSQSGVAAVAACGAGFVTAAANPLTAAYFLSAFLASDNMPAYRVAAPVIVTATALAVFLLVASALASPAARQAALRWNRPIRISAALLLGAMAARSAWPVISAQL